MSTIRRIITRKEWGARKPRSVTRNVWRRPIGWVHHTESNGNPITFADECREMRNIQNFHMDSTDGDKPWSDIGYNYVIFPSGRIYEGRGKNVRGAHCSTANDQPGIAFYGNFESTLPTAQAFAAFRFLQRTLNIRDIKGHKDGYDTDCPGERLYNYYFRN